MRADASETELSVAVARHFEAMPVDEEAILGRFFEHLDGVDGGEPYGDDVDGVAKVHEQVAAKVSLSEENGSWILASVVKYDATSDAYAVQDEDDSKIIELPASRVRHLGLPEDGLDELAKGERVVAIFPETTSFYRAVVSKAPKRGPGGAPSEIVLKFEDDEDDAGRTPHRRVSLRYVLRERQHTRWQRRQRRVPVTSDIHLLADASSGVSHRSASAITQRTSWSQIEERTRVKHDGAPIAHSTQSAPGVCIVFAPLYLPAATEDPFATIKCCPHGLCAARPGSQRLQLTRYHRSLQLFAVFDIPAVMVIRLIVCYWWADHGRHREHSCCAAPVKPAHFSQQ